MKLTNKTKALLQEVLERVNERRKEKKRQPITLKDIPGLDLNLIPRYYLVDTFQVKRHWRRKPIRK